MTSEEKLDATSKTIAAELNDVLLSIDTLLKDIEEAVLREDLDIEQHIFDKSIWNNIGLYGLRKKLPEVAETVFRAMLETIKKYEKKKDKTLYKGLALNNLGIALYLKGEFDEAKHMLELAAEEDKKIYGKEAPEKSRAISALAGLSFCNTNRLGEFADE